MAEFDLITNNKKFNNFDELNKIVKNIYFHTDEVEYNLNQILEIFNSTNIDLDNPTQYKLNFDSPIIIFYLGLYFQYVNIDYTLMKSCYEKNIQLNSHSNSMLHYGIYLEEIEINAELAIKYYKMATEYSNSYAYYKLGNIIIKENDNNTINEEAKEYFISGIKMSNVMCLMRLLHYLLVEEKDYESVIKYANLFYETHNDKRLAGYILYEFMRKFNEYDIGIKYIDLLIRVGYEEAKITMAEFYLDIVKNNQIGLSILLELAQKGNPEAFNMLRDKTCSNQLQFYFWLKRMEFDNELKQLLITGLETTDMVQDYHCMVQENSSKVQECFICCNERVMVNFSCGHIICERCYVNMNQCYYKCNHLHIKENYHEQNKQVYDNIYNNLYKYQPDEPKNLNISQSCECKK
jgi:hypothetical protein